MSDDAYSVCQHCFELTPGLFTFEGRVYCEDCFKVLAGSDPGQVASDANAADTSESTPQRKPRRLSAMSLRTSQKGNSKHAVFASPPIPPPTPSRPTSRPRPQSVPPAQRRIPAKNYEEVRVLHRGVTIVFFGARIGSGVHDGLNALWAYEQPSPPPGKYTWIGVFQRRDGDYIVASRISRTDGPGSGIAFRFSRDQLRGFLKSAIPKAPPAEARIWQWVSNSWTVAD